MDMMESPPQLLLQAVTRETSGSKMLWSARPDPWGYARSRWKHAWFGIPFTAFAVFWTWGASGGFSRSNGKSPPPFFVLWGCMFIVIGLCILLSPVFALWKARRVFYVMTERSAIIFEKTWSLKIQSFDASGFGGFERVSRGDREGDILFQRTIERRGKGTRVTEIGFLGLQDFAEAERALRSMMELHNKSA
jgi:hypothetical protein